MRRLEAYALIAKEWLAELLCDPRFEFTRMTLHDDGLYQCAFRSELIPRELDTHQVCIARGEPLKIYMDLDT